MRPKADEDGSAQVGDLPEDQITLRALRDVNVPKFLKATAGVNKGLGVRSRRPVFQLASCFRGSLL